MAQTKLLRTGIALVLAAFALMFAAFQGVGTAHAETLQGANVKGLTAQSAAINNGLVNGHTYVIYSNVASNKALDVSGASSASGANVQSWAFNRTVAQRWKYTVDASGCATLTCVCSGKVLDVRSAGTGNGTNVWQYAPNGTKAQKWFITKNSDGTYKIETALKSGMVLDVSGASSANGANVQIYSNNNTKAQKWRFYDVSTMYTALDNQAKASKTLPAGTYYIRSSKNRGMVLDVSGGSYANSANVQLYSLNRTNAQKWTISYDSKGYATIRNGSGKVLDVSGARVDDTTNVQQYQSNSTLAQKWIISKNSDGTYTIKSALWTDYVVDLKGASTTNGANIQMYTSNSTVAQKWWFDTESSVANETINITSSAVRNSFNGISLAGAKAVGIDVSQWNGNINWSQVKAAGINFAIIRCGYGSNYTSQDDTKWLQNIRGARAAGLDVGVYLYSYAPSAYGLPSASSEADHTLRLLRDAGIGPGDLKYGVYIDVEEGSQYNSNLLYSVCTTYCDKMRSAGYQAGIYSSLSWWNSVLTSSKYNSYNRWVAQWPYKTGNRKCDYKGTYRIWQCMSDGSVPGISGNVDMDLAY